MESSALSFFRFSGTFFLVQVFESTGSFFDFYIRNVPIFNTLVRFHPFLLFFVHALALIDILHRALIVSYWQ
jgi:hypothetical protein